MHYDNPTGMLYYPGFQRKEVIQSLYAQNEYRAEKYSLDFGLRTDKRNIKKGYEQIGPSRNIIENVSLDPLMTAAFGGSYTLSKDSLLTS